MGHSLAINIRSDAQYVGGSQGVGASERRGFTDLYDQHPNIIDREI